MKVDWTKKTNGLDMKDLRDFARRNIPRSINGARLAYIARREQRRIVTQCMNRGERWPSNAEIRETCKQYLGALQELGYIEASLGQSSDDDRYKLTDLGITFLEKRKVRFSRETAQRHLNEFLRRCQDLNAQSPRIDRPETICQVDEVFVFGSFVNQSSDDVGDVDIVVVLSVRDDGLFRKHLYKISRIMSAGEALTHAPEIIALKKLRRGLTVLSVGTRLPDGVTGTSVFQQSPENQT